MAHVITRFTQRLENSRMQRRSSRRLEAFLRDPHLAKDIGMRPRHPEPKKPVLW